MDKEKIIEILEDYEFFVDDDFGGHYEHIDCSQKARIPLGILEILDYISNLEQQVKKQKEVIEKATNDLQQIIDNVKDRTIISLGQFIPKLEIIQDELNGSNDILKEVSE